MSTGVSRVLTIVDVFELKSNIKINTNKPGIVR